MYKLDMSLLLETQPAILVKFLARKFVFYSAGNKFSAMAIDQCHEQL